MSTSLENVVLKEAGDYKFLAYITAEKLRNTNFKPAMREVFIKSLIEHIKPVCTYKSFERIERIMSDVSHVKQQEEAEAAEKIKQGRNKKEKNFRSIKLVHEGINYREDDNYESESEGEDQ